MNFLTSILCITQLHWLNNLFTATVSLSAVSRNTAGAQWSLLFDIVQKIKSHVCLLDKPNLIQTIKLMTHMLKVSKFQKENMKSSHFPKSEQKNLKNSVLSIQDRIFQIFSFRFWEVRRLHIFLLKFTDLYIPLFLSALTPFTFWPILRYQSF